MILGWCLLLCTVVFGFGMQIFERSIGISDTYDKYLDVANSMWIVILGVTTVGYGDITPNTHIARFMTALGCFIGNVVLILITIVISNMISHNERELQAYSFIDNFQNRYTLRDHAAVLI
jgi:Ion channel